MKSNEKSRAMILSFLSQIVNTVVGLLYTPLTIRILGQNEYGLYQLVNSVISYLSLMNLGFNGAYIRYYSLAKAEGKDEKVANINGMFFDVFMIITILCLLAGVVLYFNIGILGSKLTEADYDIAKILLIILVVNLAFSFPNSLFVAYIAANENFVFQQTLNITMNILVPVLTLPLLYFGYGSIGMVFITLALTVARLLVNVFHCFKRLNMKINIFYFDKQIFAGLLGYTFFIFLSDLVDQMNSNVDKFLLGTLSGTIAVAVYSVGFNLKSYYTTVSWIAPEMYIPEVNRVVVEDGSNDKLTELFTKIGRLNNYIVLLVFTGFIVFGRQFIYLWVGEEYAVSYYATLILMVSGYIPAVQTLGTNIQNAKNMHQMRSIVYFFVACVNIIASVFLIKLWGVVGTCLGTLFATIIGHGFFMNYYYHKKVGLNIVYFWKEIMKWWIPSLVVFGLGYFLVGFFDLNGWIKLFIGIFSYTVVYGITLFIFGLNKEEKKLILNKIKR